VEWPATKPTARSPDPVAVAGPEEADVLCPDVPTDPSSAFEVATPLNSSSCKTTAAAPVVTVTLVTEPAPAAYQSSPSEFTPAVK
jgi:hypothetical protein